MSSQTKESIVIRTVEDLRAAMSAASGEPTTDENLVWFVCFYNAKIIAGSFSLKDIAHMLQDGCTAINKISNVKEWLETEWQYYEETKEDPSQNILDHINEFYGK